jgi:hypothetical protein
MRSRVMDQAIGGPVVELAQRQAAEIHRWLIEQFGLNDGRARCALLCGIIAPGTPVKVCESDAVFGRTCFPAARGTEEPRLGPQPHSYTEQITRAASASGRSEVVCATVKNWSHNLQREFTLEVP